MQTYLRARKPVTRRFLQQSAWPLVLEAIRADSFCVGRAGYILLREVGFGGFRLSWGLELPKDRRSRIFFKMTATHCHSLSDHCRDAGVVARRRSCISLYNSAVAWLSPLLV